MLLAFVGKHESSLNHAIYYSKRRYFAIFWTNILNATAIVQLFARSVLEIRQGDGNNVGETSAKDT